MQFLTSTHLFLPSHPISPTSRYSDTLSFRIAAFNRRHTWALSWASMEWLYYELATILDFISDLWYGLQVWALLWAPLMGSIMSSMVASVVGSRAAGSSGSTMGSTIGSIMVSCMGSNPPTPCGRACENNNDKPKYQRPKAKIPKTKSQS